MGSIKETKWQAVLSRHGAQGGLVHFDVDRSEACHGERAEAGNNQRLIEERRDLRHRHSALATDADGQYLWTKGDVSPRLGAIRYDNAARRLRLEAHRCVSHPVAEQ